MNQIFRSKKLYVVLTPLLVLALWAVFGTTPVVNAHTPTTIELSTSNGATVCPAAPLYGTWDGINQSCNLYADVTIPNGLTLQVDSGVTLQEPLINSLPVVGNINNYGILLMFGSLEFGPNSECVSTGCGTGGEFFNYGTVVIEPSGGSNFYGTFLNYGTLINFGFIGVGVDIPNTNGYWQVGQLPLIGPQPFSNYGTVDSSSGSIVLDLDNIINNYGSFTVGSLGVTSGCIALGGNGGEPCGAPASAINNYGTMTITNNVYSDCTNNPVSFSNYGKLNVEGTLTWGCVSPTVISFTNNGHITNTGIVSNSGPFLNGGIIQNKGSLSNYGIATFSNPGTFVNYCSAHFHAIFYSDPTVTLTGNSVINAC